MYGLSDNFIDSFINGMLKSILDLVKRDSTLCLQIRENYINIYYRGGSIARIHGEGNGYTIYFNEKFIVEPCEDIILIKNLNNTTDAEAWVKTVPFLKHQMDLHFNIKPMYERECEQLVVRENNRKKFSNDTDYMICDMESQITNDKPDLIAVKWPSDQKMAIINHDLGLAFIEVKYGDKSLEGQSGLVSHIKHIKELLEDPQKLEIIKNSMVKKFNQLVELGLIEFPKAKKGIVSFSNDRPEYIFILINHDPAKSKLNQILNDLPDCPNVDIKFAFSNYMGYGLYEQNIKRIEEIEK